MAIPTRMMQPPLLVQISTFNTEMLHNPHRLPTDFFFLVHSLSTIFDKSQLRRCLFRPLLPPSSRWRYASMAIHIVASCAIRSARRVMGVRGYLGTRRRSSTRSARAGTFLRELAQERHFLEREHECLDTGTDKTMGWVGRWVHTKDMDPSTFPTSKQDNSHADANTIAARADEKD